jgi:hypothetical protein
VAWWSVHCILQGMKGEDEKSLTMEKNPDPVTTLAEKMVRPCSVGMGKIPKGNRSREGLGQSSCGSNPFP